MSGSPRHTIKNELFPKKTFIDKDADDQKDQYRLIYKAR